MMVWNVILSAVLGILAFVVKDKFAEIQRLSILVNRTREEIARDNVTQAEVDKIVAHIDARFDKLNDKLDAYVKESRSALS